MRVPRFFAVLLAALAMGTSLRAEELTLVTYNVENYTLTDRVTAAGYRPDYPKPEVAKEALRAVLHSLNADVLVLQEIGGRAFLEELRRDLAHEGQVYPHLAILEFSDEPRHVAVMSRRPLTFVRNHTDLTFNYLGAPAPVKRGLLEVAIDTPDGELTLFILHLKSRYTDRPDDPQSARRRAGEAEAIRDRILQLRPDPAAARYIIAGDLNDGPTSRPIRALLARGRTPIAELLPAADSRGETWTHRYRREDSYTRVDYLMISPNAQLQSRVRGGTARIHDGAGTRDASDHRPVVVTLSWP